MEKKDIRYSDCRRLLLKLGFIVNKKRKRFDRGKKYIQILRSGDNEPLKIKFGEQVGQVGATPLMLCNTSIRVYKWDKAYEEILKLEKPAKLAAKLEDYYDMIKS